VEGIRHLFPYQMMISQLPTNPRFLLMETLKRKKEKRKKKIQRKILARHTSPRFHSHKG